MHDPKTCFEAQQAAYAQDPYPSLAARKTALKTLKKQLLRYQDVLVDAMSSDFGFRSPEESKMLDILGATLSINHVLSNVGRWMKSSRRATEVLFRGNHLRVIYQPKGVVGIIVPWNFPVNLALDPLATALAAGNRVMIKMPEVTPATNAVLRQMLAEVFDETHVAVIGEELQDPNAFTSLPFNHIVFTGSPAVGRIVMRTAAQNLTPVTLELGGKSPALVAPGYDVAEAARRITHGKATNCGQICVSPDYALVPRAQVDAFVAAVKTTFTGLYNGNTSGNPDYTGLVHDKHAGHIQALLDDARAKGATVQACGPMGDNRQWPLHVITGVTPEMRVMQDEIFGPVLPVVPYDTLEEALAHINRGPRPLALYCFSRDTAVRDQVLQRTHSGGVTVNDWGWHAMQHAAPFGGVGNSGMGNYHGEEGFKELSHAKTVFQRRSWFPVDLFYPPYGKWNHRLTLKFFLGEADPTVKRPAAVRASASKP